jgi:hypothetical protein
MRSQKNEGYRCACQRDAAQRHANEHPFAILTSRDIQRTGIKNNFYPPQ